MNDTPTIERAHLPADADGLQKEILRKLAYAIGKDPIVAGRTTGSPRPSWRCATASSTAGWNSTRAAYNDRRQARLLPLARIPDRPAASRRDVAISAWSSRSARRSTSLGVDLDAIAELEPDAALGNGGLGRLAACFMESMATLGIPAYGYGIRYDHGLFRQGISDGWQIELPEDWLSHGNPWEFERREAAYEIGFGGTVEAGLSGDDTPRQLLAAAEKMLAVAYDTPIVGWRGKRVNTLRLWSAQAVDPIRLDAFNRGDYIGALAERTRAETITRVLYPADSTPAGQELRLRQEYFFTSASLQDIVRRHFQQFGDVRNLAEKVAIQLNDTHPAIAVAELMRSSSTSTASTWDEAWDDHPRHDRLHQPHAAAGGAGELAGAAVRAAAAAPHADHLRDQRPSSSQKRARGPRRRCRPPVVASR